MSRTEVSLWAFATVILASRVLSVFVSPHSRWILIGCVFAHFFRPRTPDDSIGGSKQNKLFFRNTIIKSLKRRILRRITARFAYVISPRPVLRQNGTDVWCSKRKNEHQLHSNKSYCMRIITLNVIYYVLCLLLWIVLNRLWKPGL